MENRELKRVFDQVKLFPERQEAMLERLLSGERGKEWKNRETDEKDGGSTGGCGADADGLCIYRGDGIGSEDRGVF